VNLLLYFVVIALAMLGLSRLLPGFHVHGPGTALLAAVVLAAVNTLVKPVLFVLTLPFTILTLGLFLFVLNAICLWITDKLVPGLTIDGAWTTLIASLVLAAVGMVWKAATSSR
jgi:putative membrane protein